MIRLLLGIVLIFVAYYVYKEIKAYKGVYEQEENLKKEVLRSKELDKQAESLIYKEANDSIQETLDKKE